MKLHLLIASVIAVLFILQELRPWPAIAQEKRNPPKELPYSIIAVAPAPDGKRLLTVAGHSGPSTGVNDPHFWDVSIAVDENGQCHPTIVKKTENWHGPICFTPNGKRIFACNGSAIVELDGSAGAELRKLAEKNETSGPIQALAISNDGKLLVAAHVGVLLPCAQSGQLLRIWDTQTGILAKSIQIDKDLAAQCGYFCCIAISKDSKNVLTGSFYGPVVEWNIATGQAARTILLPGKRHPNSGYASAAEIDYLSDRNAVCAGRGGVHILDLNKQMVVRSLRTAEDSADCRSLALSPDLRLLAVSRATNGNDSVELWDWERGKLRETLPDYELDHTIVRFSADGNYLILAGGRNTSSQEHPKRFVIGKPGLPITWIENRVLLSWDVKRSRLERTLAYPATPPK